MPNRLGLEEDLTVHIDEAIRTAGKPQPVPVNMYEAEEALVLVAPLPGVMADDIEVVVARLRPRSTCCTSGTTAPTSAPSRSPTASGPRRRPRSATDSSRCAS